jgi:hypothetical protein
MTKDEDTSIWPVYRAALIIIPFARNKANPQAIYRIFGGKYYYPGQ